MSSIVFRLVLASFAASCVLAPVAPAAAAEATTGVIAGAVTAAGGEPVPSARVAAASPSGRFAVTTDARGRFIIFGLSPDTYAVSVDAAGFETVVQRGIVVLPGQTQAVAVRLARRLQTIGSVRAASRAFVAGAPSETFTVSGDAARALSPNVSSSGLGSYTAGTVQGAIAAVPGVDLDAFANAILRGGKVDDAAFSYDSVPIPQGLIAEPGGNVVGAQLATTGIAATTVTLSGYQTQGENALGGTIDQIPAVGTYPGRTTLELGDGLGTAYRLASLQILGATPDLRWRWALASTVGSEAFSFGDGHTFYPSEAATYGVALQNRAQYSVASNLHYRLGASDDVSVLGLVGEANYDQYGSPYAGQTFGAFDGASTTYPGETDPNAPVTFPARVRGTYDVIKAQWLHTGAHSLSRVQLYQSQFGSTAGGPFWDENGFPDGSISLFARQGGRETGLGYDGETAVSDRHHLRFGAEYRVNATFLDQVVPTADETITSHPALHTLLAYLGDTWSAARRFDVAGTLRLTRTHVAPSGGFGYDVNALDPHAALAYKVGDGYAVRAAFDHTTVAPKPLEADRTDSTNVDANGNPAPFVPLAAETSNDLAFSLEGSGRTQFRVTYYAKLEKNRIDVLPFNFRSALASGLNPNGVGVPTNAGELRAHGLDLWARNGGFTLTANYLRGFSSSASQFAYNGLNAGAVAAGHLFPIGYVPDLTASLSYEFRAGPRVRVTPSLSYQTGYPYGNGRAVWTFDANGKPVQVPNDNFVNPGYSYYFLNDPSLTYDPASNPYVGSLGTPEGNDPNTLRSPSQLLVNLHAEADVSKRMTLVFDVANVFGNANPTAYQGNPYLIGPPGYDGTGLPNYPAAYQAAGGYAQPYALGNGVPTNDGVTRAVPWSYGRAGYVPQSYPLARTFQVRLRYRV